MSGTIGIIMDTNETYFFKTPVKSEQSYTKAKQNISRIRFKSLYKLLDFDYLKENSLFILERPMINSMRFKSTVSASRSIEATLICLELLAVPYIYCDSKAWQKELLPSGIKGGTELKKASMDIGCRLFPQHKDLIVGHKDADGILIAEWARRNRL